MGGSKSKNQALYGDPYLNAYGPSYGYPGQPGLAGYGGPAYTITTAPAVIQEPWAVTQWTEYYVPTVGARAKRPVIYVAAPLPAAAPANPCAGFGGGFGGGLPMGGFGGGLPMGGFGGGLPMGGYGGGLPMGGYGGGLPMGGFGGGLPAGGFGGGYGANLGYQALPMMTVAYGGGIPPVGGFGGGCGGLGGGLPLF